MAKRSITDRLNTVSKMSIIDTSTYKETFLDPETLIGSSNNFYSQENIQELADNMLLVGHLEPILIGRVNGEDRIIAGHRRTKAAVLNKQRGKADFNTVRCLLKEMTETMFMLTLLSGNMFSRELSDWEITEQVRLFRIHVSKAAAEGEIEIPGTMRQYIAKVTGLSETKVAQIDKINSSLCVEGKEALKKEEINFSTAYETSRLPQERQQEALKKNLLSTEVKAMVEQEKQEPPEREIKLFYEIIKRFDTDRDKLKEELIREYGKCHHGSGGGKVEYQCNPQKIKINGKTITWSHLVKLINKYIPRKTLDFTGAKPFFLPPGEKKAVSSLEEIHNSLLQEQIPGQSSVEDFKELLPEGYEKSESDFKETEENEMLFGIKTVLEDLLLAAEHITEEEFYTLQEILINCKEREREVR